MKLPKNSILVSLAAATLALTACGGDSTQPAQSPGGGEATQDSESGYTIGIAIPAGNETYWSGFQAGAQAAADDLGVTLNFSDARNDAQTMNDQVNTMVVSGVDGIILAPVDAEANQPSAQAARDAGIPMITGNRTLSGEYGGLDGDAPQFHTGIDDVAIGNGAAELVIEACEGIDPCNVIEIVGTLGSSAQIDRESGMAAGLEGHDNIVIVATQANDFDPTKALEITPALLQSNPDAHVITTHEDPSAIAVTRVLAEQGLTGQVKVVSAGSGSIDGIEAIAEGEIFGGVAVSSTAESAAAVRNIVALLNDEDVSLEDKDGIPTSVVESAIVTSANAAEHSGDW